MLQCCRRLQTGQGGPAGYPIRPRRCTPSPATARASTLLRSMLVLIESHQTYQGQGALDRPDVQYKLLQHCLHTSLERMRSKRRPPKELRMSPSTSNAQSSGSPSDIPSSPMPTLACITPEYQAEMIQHWPTVCLLDGSAPARTVQHRQALPGSHPDGMQLCYTYNTALLYHKSCNVITGTVLLVTSKGIMESSCLCQPWSVHQVHCVCTGRKCWYGRVGHRRHLIRLRGLPVPGAQLLLEQRLHLAGVKVPCAQSLLRLRYWHGNVSPTELDSRQVLHMIVPRMVTGGVGDVHIVRCLCQQHLLRPGQHCLAAATWQGAR